MDFLKDVLEQGRRVTVDALHGEAIQKSSPFSPEVPEDLREWLPDLFDRFPIVMPWAHPQAIDPALHTVWLLDNTAFRSPQHGDSRPDLAALKDAQSAQPVQIDESGQFTQPVRAGSGWEVEFVACLFVKHSGRDEARIVADLAHKLHVDDSDIATKKRIAARLEPFIDRVLPNRTVRINIDGKEQQTLGPSNHSGISAALHELHFTPPVENVISSSPLNLPPPFGVPCTTVIADEQGWGVISDIDDTIKVTQSADPFGILHNTFVVDEPQPIRGMPELYAHMHGVLRVPPFFYLSASPYNLYTFLRSFRAAHYPQGTLILRDASWQNLGGLIASLTENTQEYKVDRMVKIHSWFPHRKFVCIGDSTQSDPEAYGEIARRFPGWVKAIFIRKVSGIALMDEATKNADARFEKAFEGLDRQLWHVFTEPEELVERVEELGKNPDAKVGGQMWGS